MVAGVGFAVVVWRGKRYELAVVVLHGEAWQGTAVARAPNVERRFDMVDLACQRVVRQHAHQ